MVINLTKRHAEGSYPSIDSPDCPSKKTKSLEKYLPIDLKSCKTSKESLQSLTVLFKSFPVPMEQVSDIIEHLIDHFQIPDTDSVVKIKILEIVHLLIQYPCCEARRYYPVIKDLLEKELTGCVIASGLTILKTIGILNFSDKSFLTDIIHYTLRKIKNDDYIVRVKGLELLGYLASYDIPMPKRKFQSVSRTIFDDVLIDHTYDSDWRVRNSALDAILRWHSRKLPLNSSLYTQVVLLLNDDEEKIRITVVKLLWIVTQMYPGVIVSSKDGTETMMSNCFSNFCELVMDISADVREQAAKLLGSMNISSDVLNQTLHKKLMNSFTKRVNPLDKQSDIIISKIFSTCRKYPSTVVSEWVCGVFVIGLEDEFSKVRNASIDSMCELSYKHPTFAKAAMNFLVDMLTDEADSVRLNSINTLCSLSKILTLESDHLETVLGVLKEVSGSLREGTHRLLSAFNLKSKEDIKTAKTGLISNLTSYPEDQLSIFRAMKAIGERNSNLVFSVIRDFLGLHDFLENQEHDINNSTHVALTIMASNAVKMDPSKTSILPKYMLNHFLQLKNIYPDIMPDKESFEALPLSLPDQKMLFSDILLQVDQINFMRNIPLAYNLLEIACKDLSRIEDIAPKMSASAKFVTWHLECQIMINDILTKTIFSVAPKRFSLLCYQIENLAKLITDMKTIFVGLTNAQLIDIHFFSLIVSALLMILDFPSANLICKMSSCLIFSDQIRRLNDLLSKSNIPPNRMLSQLAVEIKSLQNGDVTNYYDIFLKAFKVQSSTLPFLPRVDNQINLMKATVIEPINNFNTVHIFIAHNILAIKMTVNLENIEHVERIRILVKYANQKQHVITPSLSDFKTINKMNHRLDTLVMVTGSSLSTTDERSEVKIKVAYAPPSLLDELSPAIVSGLSADSKFASSLLQAYVDLSEDIIVGMRAIPPQIASTSNK